MRTLIDGERSLTTVEAASILIVEDETMLAIAIQEVLEDAGFVVAGLASSGVEALMLAGERRPDLALVDIRLTGPTDGIEVALLLRRRFGVGSIFLSGCADPVTLSRARSAMPLGFLEKPFRPSQVFNALAHALRLKAPT